jgi:uncharacterized membrane protein YbhN (UPF0104 family)
MTPKRLLINAILILGLMLAAYLLYTVFNRYTFSEVMNSIRAIALMRLLTGVAFTAASYICLTGFDWLGLRYAGKPLSYPKAATASFASLSIGHNLGVAALSSGAVRYRYYSRWGLNAEEVAKVILFCGATVGLGLSALAGVVLLVNPGDAANLLKLSRLGLLLLGLGCLAIPLAYLTLAAVVRAPLRLWKWRFELPHFRLALAQVLIGTLNFICVAACLHQLMTAEVDVSFVKTATAFVLANIAILVTHVPGGLGVLEATVSHVLPGAASVGALVAFRVLYFLIPLFIGIPLFIISELVAKRRKNRKPSEDRVEQPGLRKPDAQTQSL